MTNWKRVLDRDPTLILEERADRQGQVYARWWSIDAQAWRRRASGMHVRSPGDEVDPVREAAVVAWGVGLHAQIQNGVGRSRGPSVREVLDRYLDSELTGAARRYRQDVERAAKVIEEVLGASTPWARVTAASAAEVWRALARRSPDGGGRRWAVRVAELLWRVGGWVELQGHTLTGTGPRAPHFWRGALMRDWVRYSGFEPEPATRPRYTPDELHALWSALDGADVRLRLALELAGPELRLGQVARARRSDVDLTLGVGVHALGTLRVRGRGAKGGLLISLDRHARRVLEAAILEGHLAGLEIALRGGEIADYFLVPGGALVGGRASVASGAEHPIAASTLRRLVQAWERQSDVESRAGRGWHALRRAAVDAAVELHDDPDVLDRLGGWSPGSGVRTRVYRDRRDERVAAEAEHVRSQLRASFRGPVNAPGDQSDKRPAKISPAPNWDIISRGH
jgi:hypothetical protein